MRAESLASSGLSMRIHHTALQELVDNAGELKHGPINSVGVLRLALDLRDTREHLEPRALPDLRSRLLELAFVAERLGDKSLAESLRMLHASRKPGAQVAEEVGYDR